MSIMKSLFEALLRRAVVPRNVTGLTIGEHPSQLAVMGHYIVGQLFAPARSYIPKLTGRLYEIADDLTATEPQLAGLVRLWAKAGDEAFRMLDELEYRRRIVPRYAATVLQAAQEHGLTRDNIEGWRHIKNLIESGRADEHLVAQLIADIYGKIDTQARRLVPNYRTRENYFPQFANREYLKQLGEEQFRAMLKARNPMLTDDELELAFETVLNKPPRLVRDLDPLIRPSKHLLMRRRITLPDEARMHPMDEALLGMNEELTYLVDTAILGFQGNKFWNLIKLLKGEILPDTVMEELPANLRAYLAEVGDVWKTAIPGNVVRSLGAGLEAIARYTMGHFPESQFEGLWRGIAAAGVIEMMAFSTIPNLGQTIAEYIVRGLGPAVRGFIRAGLGKLYWTNESEALKWMAVAMGQSQVMSRHLDLALGYNEVTAELLRNPHRIISRPVGAMKDILESFREIAREQGAGAALQKASRQYIRAVGFGSAEDYMRRYSTASVQEELLAVQRTLARDPRNAEALRILARYGVQGDDAVRQFMSMNLRDVGWTPQKIMALDPDAVLDLTPWERLFMHGIDQTQFNYMPLDFPILWAHPVLASTVFQFRRYAYQQATKLVNFAFQEAGRGNMMPLLRMAAAAWGVGNMIEFMRAGLTGRDIIWVGGKEGFARVKEPIPKTAMEAKGPLGITLNEWMIDQLRNAVAMGLFGLYTDALFTLAEGKPMLLASYFTGVYPAEAFNLVSKMAQGLQEALTAGERHPGKERFPKVKEAARYIVRQIPIVGRLAYPHLRSVPVLGSKPLEYRRLREFGLRAWVNKDWETFNNIQNRLLVEFENPITVEEAIDYQMRLALRRKGMTAVRPQPGEPGYVGRGEEPLTPGQVFEVEEETRERLRKFLEEAGLGGE